jgi:hypothetical protein
MSQINRSFSRRSTSMGAAFANAAFAALMDKKVDHSTNPLHNPEVPWVARRVGLSDSMVGTISEPTISYPRKES